MKQSEDKGGRIKDYLKGLISIGIGVVLIIVGIACIAVLPLAIVLWVIGCPMVVTGLGLIIHNKKNNTYVTGGTSSGGTSSSSSDSPKRFRHPENPSQSKVSASDVSRAVKSLSYAQVRVSNAAVYEISSDEYEIELTLFNFTGEDDMLETHANEVVDMARRAVEKLGVSARISAHF